MADIIMLDTWSLDALTAALFLGDRRLLKEGGPLHQYAGKKK